MSSERNREKHIKKFLEQQREGHEHQKLKKRASELRRAEQERAGGARRRVRRDDWEDLMDGGEEAFEGRPSRGRSTREWLSCLQTSGGGTDRESDPAAPGLAHGLVVFVTSGACRVVPERGHEAEGGDGAGREDEDGAALPPEAPARLCRLDGDLLRRQRTAIAVGDRVLFDPRTEQVRHVLPRSTWLSRPDPHAGALERVLAANVELVLVVAALREPALSVGLVERVVLAAGRGGATPLVCVTKIDLADDPASELAALGPLEATGIEIRACSARSGQGIAALRERIQGRTSALVGHSGVGKSSLLNALVPGLGLKAGAVRDADGKGRHTTSASSLFTLADGTRVIDTPGIREFGLWATSPRELKEAFPDLVALSNGCRFRDCTHDHEPDCAVRAAAARGELSPERYRSYLRILGTLRE